MLRKEIAKHGGGKGGFTLFDESLQQHILETFEDDKRELKRKFGVDLPAGKIREPVPFVANVDELINTIYHMWEEFGNWKR
jgi:hypothetical protein